MASIKYDGKGGILKANMEKAGQAVLDACRAATNDAAKAIEQRGRADIAGGGRFGADWQNAFQSHTEETSKEIKIITTMGGAPPIAYWKIFEYGATISAKNPSGMMWIPLDPGNKAWPRDYGGGLFRKGNALFDTQTKQPMYAGTPSVTIPQKFHLNDIIKQVAKELSAFYNIHMRGGV